MGGAEANEMSGVPKMAVPNPCGAAHVHKKETGQKLLFGRPLFLLISKGEKEEPPDLSKDAVNRGFQRTAATYSPNWCISTIGAGELNFSVRNGKRCDLTALFLPPQYIMSTSFASVGVGDYWKDYKSCETSPTAPYCLRYPPPKSSSSGGGLEYDLKVFK